MLSPAVLVQDIDADGWANLFSLADRTTIKRILNERIKSRTPRKRLLIMYQGENVLKAWHSEKGSLLEDFVWSGPADLEALANRYDADRVTAVERGAIPRIYENFQKKMNFKDTYVKQIFTIIEAVRAEIGKGLLFYPEPKIPHLSYEAVNQLYKIFVPDNAAIVFYLFEGERVWTSLIIGLKNGVVDLITSHDALVADGFEIKNWRKDYKKINEAVARKFREPGIGFFADLVSFARIINSKKGLKALNAARKAEDVIMEPLPMKIRGMLQAGKLLGR